MLESIIKQIEIVMVNPDVSFMNVRELPFVSDINHIGSTPATVKADLKKTIKMLKALQPIVAKIGESVIDVKIHYTKARNKKCIGIYISLSSDYKIVLSIGVKTYFSVSKQAEIVKDFTI